MLSHGEIKLQRPYLDGDVPLGHLAHVEAHGWDHVLAELARLQEQSAGSAERTAATTEVVVGGSHHHGHGGA